MQDAGGVLGCIVYMRRLQAADTGEPGYKKYTVQWV